MPKKLRIGIIGCGKIATVSHVPDFMATGKVQIVALLDKSREKAELMRKTLVPEAECFRSLDKILAADLDAVSICTPNNLHYSMTLKALKAGRHVLCEKPLAGTAAEAARMVRAARKAKRVLQTNLSLRYIPDYVTMADLVAKGRIGTPIHARCIRASGTTPDKGWSPGATWFVKKRSQGGIILDIAVHMADFLKFAVGDIAKVAAITETRTPGLDVIDTATALLKFKNGATGHLEVSWAMPTGAGLLEIYGTKGSIRMGFSDKPIELTRIGRTGKEVTYPDAKKGVKSSFATFVDAIHGKATSPRSGEVGRDAVALCDAISDSGKLNEFVKVKSYR